MIVSIHQPNYIPWIGFFEKILLSDTFVYFDNVQMPKNKSLVSRNKIYFNKKHIWLTVPINRIGTQNIHKVKIFNVHWKKKHLDTMFFGYKKEKFFSESFNIVKEVIMRDNVYLADLNIQIIEELLKLLKIKNVNIVRASQLPLQKTGIESLFEILKLLNAKVYLSGMGKGTSKYIDDKTLKKFNIKLKFCNTKMERYYPDYEKNQEILSVLDLLFRKGINDITKIFSSLKVS